MISLIERGETNPSAAVLGRLATALGVALASFFQSGRDGTDGVFRRADQIEWRDPVTGYLRRTLSPPVSRCSINEIVLPPGIEVALDNGPQIAGISQQVVVLDGRLLVDVGPVRHELDCGDCLSMHLGERTAFTNPTTADVRYLVVIDG